MRNEKLRLVKGAPTVNDLLGHHLDQDQSCSLGGGGLLLLDAVYVGLRGGSGAVATPEGDPSLILSTLEGPPARIPSSRGSSTPLGAPSKTG